MGAADEEEEEFGFGEVDEHAEVDENFEEAEQQEEDDGVYPGDDVEGFEEGAADELGEPESAQDAPDEPAPEGAEEDSLTMITTSRFGRHSVAQRRQLNTQEEAERFSLELVSFIEKQAELGKDVVFEDFDISQNAIPPDVLGAIFTSLNTTNLRIERLRCFGIPTMNDDAVTLVASWLATVTHEYAPYEIHLSDCAITKDGFLNLAEAIDSNDAFPPPDPRSRDKNLALYLRLENNYIDEAVMREKVDEGLFAVMMRSSPVNRETKCRLLVREDGKLQQRTGDPPAPEDAPPPKPVNDRLGKSKGKGYDTKGKGKGKGKDKGKGKGKGKGKDWDDRRDRWSSDWRGNRDGAWDTRGDSRRTQWVATWTRPAEREPPWKRSGGYDSYVRGGSVRATDWSGTRRERSRSREARRASGYTDIRPEPRKVSPRRRSEYKVESGKGKSTVSGKRAPVTARAAARAQGDDDAPDTRSAPDPRHDAKKPRTVADVAVKIEKPSRLPGLWEEHFSEEYKLPYFWHPESGESMWTRPVKP